jgi:hypothetical protein
VKELFACRVQPLTLLDRLDDRRIEVIRGFAEMFRRDPVLEMGVFGCCISQPTRRLRSTWKRVTCPLPVARFHPLALLRPVKDRLIGEARRRRRYLLSRISAGSAGRQTSVATVPHCCRFGSSSAVRWRPADASSITASRRTPRMRPPSAPVRYRLPHPVQDSLR